VVNQAVHNVRLLFEDVGDQVLLLAVDQERHELGEVSSQHGVQRDLSLSDESEEAFQKHELAEAFLLLFFFWLGLKDFLGVHHF
jgi:hypothetical protein